ncbi:MAG: HEAT repeat domain-containing protein [Candidatus Omnitrophica bacterium]|nr:HEAT repeat domain-containing protein [Candidatus Omnitrophota bacterium]
MESSSPTPTPPEQEKSFFGIIIHSFFIIPFLIAVFCILLFASVKLLTHDKRTIYDLLDDVKIGGITKRWQSAFELSKILNNSERVPSDEKFFTELRDAFEQSYHDPDPRVRQYLAIALGQTGNLQAFEPLTKNIHEEKEPNLYAVIYGLGLLRDPRAAPILHPFANHPTARIRSVVVVALGDIGEEESKEILKKALSDSEPNVQWGSAISLAQMNDLAGKEVLLKLLDRTYLQQFPEVDAQEQTQLMLVVIEQTVKFKDPQIEQAIKKLSRTDQNMKIRAKALEVLK